MAPIAEPLLKIPDAVDLSSGGNHSVTNFNAAGQFPASPTPRRNLTMPNCNGVITNAWINPAVVQKAMHKEYPIRVPNLSITKPETAFDNMYATKNAVPMYPNASSGINFLKSPVALR